MRGKFVKKENFMLTSLRMEKMVSRYIFWTSVEMAHADLIPFRHASAMSMVPSEPTLEVITTILLPFSSVRWSAFGRNQFCEKKKYGIEGV